MRHVILHGHIFKNAGTTFDWSLERCFGEGFVDHRDDKTMRERRARHLAELVNDAPSLRALSSHHLCFPRPDLEDVTFHPVYFLRHPIERIASVYAFERRQDAGTRGARAAKEKSFTEYVRWRFQDDVPGTIRDYQTCNITGFHDTKTKQAPVNWLRRAMNHLAAIDCVGVVDRYDESMVVFEEKLSPWFPDIDLAYRAQNVTDPKSEVTLEQRVSDTLERLGELAVEVIRMNSYDLALYRQANQKLDAALAELPDVEQRLDAFRKRCRKLKSKRRRLW